MKNQRNMGKASGAWNTAYGPRRVKQEPPTLEEAIAAAQGLTDEPNEQAEIAASLMGVAADASVLAEVKKALARAAAPRATVTSKGRGGAQRAVVVERKTVRRPGTVKRFGY